VLCVGENPTIANSYGLEYQLTIANAKFSSFREKHVMLQRQLEMQNFFVKKK